MGDCKSFSPLFQSHVLSLLLVPIHFPSFVVSLELKVFPLHLVEKSSKLEKMSSKIVEISSEVVYIFLNLMENSLNLAIISTI